MSLQIEASFCPDMQHNFSELAPSDVQHICAHRVSQGFSHHYRAMAPSRDPSEVLQAEQEFRDAHGLQWRPVAGATPILGKIGQYADHLRHMQEFFGFPAKISTVLLGHPALGFTNSRVYNWQARRGKQEQHYSRQIFVMSYIMQR